MTHFNSTGHRNQLDSSQSKKDLENRIQYFYWILSFIIRCYTIVTIFFAQSKETIDPISFGLKRYITLENGKYKGLKIKNEKIQHTIRFINIEKVYETRLEARLQTKETYDSKKNNIIT